MDLNTDGILNAKGDYPQQLYRYTEESCRKEEAFHILQYKFLQRLNIVNLQNKLAEIKSRVHDAKRCDDATAEKLKIAIADYSMSTGLLYCDWTLRRAAP